MHECATFVLKAAMAEGLLYSFYDIKVKRFMCDIENRNVLFYFDYYFGVMENDWVEKPCVFSIEQWERAYYGVIDDKWALNDLTTTIGTLTDLYHMEYEGEIL